jgi:hypothetical protein
MRTEHDIQIVSWLTIEDGQGWSDNELPWYCHFHEVNGAFTISIGKWRIGKIFRTNKGRFFVSEIHNPRGFKSMKAALRGIKERIDGR